MRSQLSERLGVETPQIVHCPPDVHSLAAAEEAIELADAYGICDGHPLAPSQRVRLRGACGERADGSWAATTIADFGGRQGAGKTDTIAAREIAGLILFGENLIIHTAHEFPTANESFLRVVSVFEAWDDLRRRVSRIRYANGEQGVELKTGQRLKYRARTGGSGRGFAKADLVVYDEAQHLTGEHVAASGPARLSNPNSQSWYAGSGGLSHSSQAWRLRRRALSGAGGRLSYTEHTAETVELVNGKVRSAPPDAEDRDAWARANPGLGRWVTEEAMASLLEELGPDLFARECLCVWDPEPGDDGNDLIPGWTDLKDPANPSTGYAGSKIASHDMWAIATSPDRKWSTIGIAGRRTDGRIHVESLHRQAGTGWVVDRAEEIWNAKRIPVRVHKTGPEGSFITLLRERGIEVVEVTSTEFAQATSQFVDAGNEDKLRHLDQPSLNRAVSGAVVREQTDGAVLWSQRTSTVEITPLVAVTVALGGVPKEPAQRTPRIWTLTAKTEAR